MLKKMSRRVRRSGRLQVTVVSPYFEPEHSGSAPYVTQVARHLATDHDVTVLTGVPHYPQWQVRDGYGRWRERRVEGGLEVRRLRHYVPRTQSVLRRAWYEASFALRVLLELPRLRSDVVIAFTPPVMSTAAARLLARAHRAGFGVVVHDLAGLGARESGMRGGGRVSGAVAALESASLKSADGVVVLHPQFLKHVPSLPAPAAVEVIRNWSSPLPAPRSVAETRRRFGWADGRCVVLHSGNMGLKQGLENVVEAARLADERGTDVVFVLMGDGSRREEIERAGAGLERLDVRPPAGLKDFADMLRAADVLLVNEKPGVSEMSVPSKLTAYFAAERPVVVASSPESPAASEVTEAGAGVQVTSGDPAALLDAVMRLHDDLELSTRLGHSGAQFAAREFDAARALARYNAWVRSIARAQ